MFPRCYLTTIITAHFIVTTEIGAIKINLETTAVWTTMGASKNTSFRLAVLIPAVSDPFPIVFFDWATALPARYREYEPEICIIGILLFFGWSIGLLG